MKAITREWLDRAKDDLLAASLLLTQPELTNMVAFHAQQAVEKSLKACLEEADIAAVKTHSLTHLYGLLELHLSLLLDQDMLDRLEAVYIESRYPGEMGLLPYGKPTEKEAKQFYDFAQHFYEQVQTVLEIDEDSDSPTQEKDS
jgi:HEPN domain-containing protein